MNLLTLLQMHVATPIETVERIIDLSARLITVKLIEKKLGAVSFKCLKFLNGNSTSLVFFPTHLGYVVFKEHVIDSHGFDARPLSIDGYSLFKRLDVLEKTLHNIEQDTKLEGTKFLKHDPDFEMTGADALVLTWGFDCDPDMINDTFESKVVANRMNNGNVLKLSERSGTSTVEICLIDSTDITISYLM